jgi:hypothetical protein
MLSRHATRLLAGSPAGRCQHFAVCALVALAAATTARAAPTRCGADTPLGSHAMVYLDAPYSFKEAMFRESARLGASEIRVDLALTAVFPAPGTEDWRQVDEVMALARRFRLRPLGVLLATPAFIAACPPGAPSYTCPPADLDAWKQMVATLVAHTRGVIDTFEILNEPDGHWAFTGTPADYAALLRAGHDAITAANPHAKIAIAATMSLGSQPWLNHVLADAGPHAEHPPSRSTPPTARHRARLAHLLRQPQRTRQATVDHRVRLPVRPRLPIRPGLPLRPRLPGRLPATRAPHSSGRSRHQGLRDPPRQPRRSVRL